MSDNEHKPFVQRLRESAHLGGLAVRLAWDASPKLVLASLSLVILQSVLPAIQLALSKGVIDSAALDLHLRSGTDTYATQLPTTVWVLLAAVVIGLGRLILPFAETLQSMLGDRLTGYFARRIMRSANRWKGLERFEDPAFADDVERVRGASDRVGLELLIYGTRTAVQAFTTISLILVLASLNPIVPVALVLAAVPRMGWEWEYVNRTGSALYVQTPETRRLRYCFESMLSPELAKDVRLYWLGPFFRDRYNSIFDRAIDTLDGIRRRMATRVALAGLLSGIAAGAVYVYVVWAIPTGSHTVGDLALYGGAATMLVSVLESVAFNLGFFPMAYGLYLPSLVRVLEAPPDLREKPSPAPAPRHIREGIEFEGVSFTYPGGSVPTLREVSFRWRSGENIALVGRNGAGKTTIVKLLLRMYDPTEGRILLDGTDLREYDLDELRRAMGVIFQDFVQYKLTVGENIGLGRLECLEDRDYLMNAAEKAGASTLVSGLPQGLDTRLSREFGGRELSGGEWQKLALSRAFVRDSQLLVLDEPTASLDVQTEYDVYTRFHELTREKMTLLISHRFSTVRMADRILYLHEGAIREEGTHEHLMALSGEYARMYELQAAQYIDREGGG